MKKQRILSALLTLCLVFSLMPTALAAGADDFTDVGKDSWCYDYVDYVTSEGYFRGTTDTTFSPNRNMTRAMFVVVLSRFDGAKVDNSQSSFTDVEPGAWCAGAIEWAAGNGIVTGKGDGRFAPNDPITRAQMCAIMDRYVDYYTAENDVTVARTGKAGTLADQSQVPAYAAEAVQNCQIYGLINGYEDGTFRPQAYSTRAHVAAIIYRLAFLLGQTTGEVTLIVNGKTFTVTVTVGPDGTFEVPDLPAKVSSSGFIGWKNSEDGKTYKPGASCKYVEGMKLTARYSSGGSSGGGGGSHKPTPTPEIDPSDLIGFAVQESMKQADDRYEAAKKAIKDAVDAVNAENKYFTKEQLAEVEKTINGVLTVGDVTFNSTIKGDARYQTLTASVKVDDDLAATIITKATAMALDLVDAKPTADDVDSLLQAVMAAVEEETGIEISGQSYEQIKTQVIERVMAEGKSLWENFQDGKGGYYCGDITVTAGDETVGVYTATIQVDADNHATTLVGTSKTDAVKNVAEKVAKQMFQELKEQSAGEYVSNATISGTVTLTFEDAEAYKDKTNGFPHEYPVTLQLKLDSDSMVQYKFADGENYLKLRITDAVKEAYIDSIDTVAKTIVRNDAEVREALAEVVTKALEENSDELCGALAAKLEQLGLDGALTEGAKNAIGAVLTDAETVDNWLDANMDALYASLGSGEIENLDNSVLIDAVWGVLTEEHVLPQEQDEMAEWVDAVITAQTEDFDLVGMVEKNPTVQLLANGLGITIEGPADINKLMEAEVRLDGQLLTGKDIVKMQAEEELDSRFTGSKYESIYDKLSQTAKDYLIYATLTDMELDFGADEKRVESAALNELLAIIADPDVFEEFINTKIDEKLTGIDIDEILSEAGVEAEKYAELVNLLNELKSSAVKEKTFSGLANVLRNETLQEKVGSRGDTVVARYLARVIDRIPAGASIEMNGVTIDKDALGSLAAAETTVGAMDALAGILEKFGELRIADFEEPGIPVEVTYNSRNFAFNLVISDK